MTGNDDRDLNDALTRGMSVDIPPLDPALRTRILAGVQPPRRVLPVLGDWRSRAALAGSAIAFGVVLAALTEPQPAPEDLFAEYVVFDSRVLGR